jgi:hypothetical protein
MAKPKGSPKSGGRQPGSANKVTLEARHAIALFVDSNAHRLSEWLDQVANGAKGMKMTKDGKAVEVFIVDPQPAKAFELFQSVVEYHVPKLARTEILGTLDVKTASDMTDAELAAIATSVPNKQAVH